MDFGQPLFEETLDHKIEAKVPPSRFTPTELTLLTRCKIGDAAGLEATVPPQWTLSYRHLRGAVLSGDLRTAKFVLSRYPFPVNSQIALLATRHNYLDIVQYLHSQNNKVFTCTIANNACKHGRLHILRWLWRKRVMPNMTGMVEAVRFGHHHVVQWMMGMGYYPSQLVREAVELTGDPQMLNLFHGLYTTGTQTRHHLPPLQSRTIPPS